MWLRDLAYRSMNVAGRWIGRDAPFIEKTVDRPAVEHRPEITDTPLGQIFINNDGRTIHKWIHYFPIYERYFAPYRNTDLKMLEIGVFQGGSLEMWRSYFGQAATLFGVDINPDCARFFDPPNQVRIGSQDDPAFLRRVVAEMGGLDIVLDDGSHVAGHQQTSFDTLFPLLKDGGLYVIEDVHTAYWPKGFEGGFRRPGTAIELGKDAVDDLHHWYHGRPALTAARGHIGAVHFHDSIIVIEKRAEQEPVNLAIGRWNVASAPPA